MSDASLKKTGKVIALCGGVGGAKLAWGLAQVLSPEQLTLIVNTGDDFEHLGLHISPDIDTVLYTLAHRNNRELGWGLQDESWQCMAALEQLGGETWFRLGDKDLATHFFRTQLLASGKTLTQVTAQLSSALGITHRILPMCDTAQPTLVDTEQSTLAFQHYFVREQCKPVVRGVRYQQANNAQMSDEVRAALTDHALTHIIICPSNPWLSIAPILAVPELRALLQTQREKITVVSPLIGGQAVKGPTAKMMAEMQIATDSFSIADFYRDLLGTLVIDDCDAQDTEILRAEKIHVTVFKTLMRSDADKIGLAKNLLGAC